MHATDKSRNVRPWASLNSVKIDSQQQIHLSERTPNSNTILAAYAPLKEWSNKCPKSSQYKHWTFPRRTASKQWNNRIIKSYDDFKIEPFPGARPPDTIFSGWYDLTLVLVCNRIILICQKGIFTIHKSRRKQYNPAASSGQCGRLFHTCLRLIQGISMVWCCALELPHPAISVSEHGVYRIPQQWLFKGN